MIFQIDKSFEKDVRKQKDSSLNKKLALLLSKIESAEELEQIPHLKKLSGYQDYYRIRLGDYRIGLELAEGVVTLIRCLHRKDIYKYFPK